MSSSYSDLLRLFNKHIDDIILQKQDLLSAGSVSDYAAYKNECGLINGLKQAKNELREVIKKTLRDEDELEEENT